LLSERAYQKASTGLLFHTQWIALKQYSNDIKQKRAIEQNLRIFFFDLSEKYVVPNVDGVATGLCLMNENQKS